MLTDFQNSFADRLTGKFAVFVVSKHILDEWSANSAIGSSLEIKDCKQLIHFLHVTGHIRTVADPVKFRKLLKSQYFSQAFNIC